MGIATDQTMTSNFLKFVTSFPDPQEKIYNQENWELDHSNALVVINCQANNIYYPLHWTPLSLKTVISGQEHYIIEGRRYTVDQNNFLILNEGTWYESYIRDDECTESFTINFNRQSQLAAINLITASASQLLENTLNVPVSFPEFMLRLYRRIDNFSVRLKHLRHLVTLKQMDLRAEETVHQLLADLMQLSIRTSNEVDNIVAKKRSTREELYRRLHMAKDFIHSNYATNISLDLLAKTSYLNSYYLLRAFKSYFGVSPGQYLIQRRMEVANSLILNTLKPVNQICYAVGYNDLSSFSKLFKDYYGLAPLQARKNHLRLSINRLITEE